MNYDYQQLVQHVLADTAGSLELFLPELTLCGTILFMLVFRVSDLTRRWVPSWLFALAGAVLALYFAAPWLYLGDFSQPRTEIFTGMLVFDNFTTFFRGLLLFFAVLFIVLTKISGIPDHEDGADFYTLVLGAILGMCLMASANHLLMVFLAVEMASVPSYVLAGFLKGRRQAGEAALKYSIYGAGTAGVMLYGISLIVGVTGSAHLPTIAWRLAEGAGGDMTLVLLLGGSMLMVGLAFKLSAVPFHFWCPDVFEGASAEVNAFLSVASKAAALALLVRVAVGISNPPSEEPRPLIPSDPTVAQVQTMAGADRPAVAQVQTEAQDRVQTVAQVQTGVGPGQLDVQASSSRTRHFISYLVAILAAVTCTFGNLAAYGQTNIKRLLAYSTIAHAGYMMMPIAAGLWLMGDNDAAAQKAFASLLVYAGIYLFMNLGAFAVVAFLRNEMRSEEIADYAGLVRSSPGIVICFSAILFSLIGLPPLAGFLGKLVIFAGLADARMYTLLTIGGINTAISLFYYLRVVKVMTFDAERDDRPPARLSLLSIPGIYVAAITAPVLLLIVQWDGLNQWALAACEQVLGH